MKQKFLLFAFILSLGLNIAFIAGGVYQRWKFRPEALFSELRLSKSQIEQMKSLDLSFRAKIDPLHTKMRLKREELLSLLKESTPQNKEIKQKIEEISNLQCALHRLTIDNLLEKRGILTPEQQNKFFSILSRRFFERRHERFPFSWKRRGQPPPFPSPRRYVGERSDDTRTPNQGIGD